MEDLSYLRNLLYRHSVAASGPTALARQDGCLCSSRDCSHRSVSGSVEFSKGVSQGFERILEIVGVGYRAEVSGQTATFHLGYSHPIVFELPEGINANIDKSKITLTGIDKELLGRTAAKIRSFRKPEPYKGKGIKYANEVIKRKAGKSGAKE